MKNRDLVSRWPHSFPLPDGYTEPAAGSLLAAPAPSESAGTSLLAPFGAFPSLPRPPLSSRRTSLEHGGFSLRLPLPASLPPSPARPGPATHTHARTAGGHKGFQSRPLYPPTAARAAPAPALAQQGCVFFGSQRPPLLSISYGTPPGFKADSSGKAGEMDSVGSEGACPLSFPPPRVFLPTRNTFLSEAF